mmetsp:Transcript_48766/g.103687  ORF Transcript_48766/g.103687 Transcript_48766/m.103687 type:complete len:410 (+) Transcript_48766:395-1624(+)
MRVQLVVHLCVIPKLHSRGSEVRHDPVALGPRHPPVAQRMLPVGIAIPHLSRPATIHDRILQHGVRLHVPQKPLAVYDRRQIGPLVLVGRGAQPLNAQRRTVPDLALGGKVLGGLQTDVVHPALHERVDAVKNILQVGQLALRPVGIQVPVLLQKQQQILPVGMSQRMLLSRPAELADGQSGVQVVARTSHGVERGQSLLSQLVAMRLDHLGIHVTHLVQLHEHVRRAHPLEEPMTPPVVQRGVERQRRFVAQHAQKQWQLLLNAQIGHVVPVEPRRVRIVLARAPLLQRSQADVPGRFGVLALHAVASPVRPQRHVVYEFFGDGAGGLGGRLDYVGLHAILFPIPGNAQEAAGTAAHGAHVDLPHVIFDGRLLFRRRFQRLRHPRLHRLRIQDCEGAAQVVSIVIFAY